MQLRFTTMMKFFMHILIITIAFLVSSGYSLGDVNHLELGAANYGADAGNHILRYDFLKRTIQDVINRDGPRGVIYLNDIVEDGLELAQNTLVEWLRQKGYSNIRVTSILGDYNEIDIPYVHSAHLGNPGHDQLPNKSGNESSNRRIIDGLKRLAIHSDTGLTITSFFHAESSQNYMGLLGDLLVNDKDWSLVDTGRVGDLYFSPNPSVEIASDFVPRIFLFQRRAAFRCVPLLTDI